MTPTGSQTSLSAQQAANRRRLAFAQLLQQQGAQPIQQREAGGFVVQNSPLEYANKLAQQLLGGYLGGKAEDEGLALKSQRNQALIEALRGGGDVAQNLANAGLSDEASAFAMKQAENQSKLEFERGKYQLGNEFLPARAGLTEQAKNPALMERAMQGKQVDLALNPEIAARTAQATLPYKTAVAEAGRSINNISVEASKGIAKQVGPMLKDSYNAAMGAVKTIDAADRILGALDKGGIIAGPAASLRVFGAQVGQLTGLGGKDAAEQLTRTRDTIRGLAEFSLNARSALQGQGQITEGEQKLLERASGGDIDSLTAPEIRQITAITRRQAQKLYGNHQQRVQLLAKDPETAGLAPYFELPALAQPVAPTVMQPSTPPSVQSILDKYR